MDAQKRDGALSPSLVPTATGPTRYRLLLADQALYAASNLAAVVLAGRVGEPAGFGRFMLVFLGLSVTVNAVRAVWSEPEMARRRASAHPGRPLAAVVASGAGAVAVAGMAGRAPLAAVVLAAAVAVVLQDRLRYRALLRHDAVAALRSDGAWTAVVVAAGAVLSLPGRPGPTIALSGVLGLWTVGAALAALLNLPPAPTASPEPAGTREHATPIDVGSSARVGRSPVPTRALFAADFALQSGATQMAGLLLGLVMATAPYGELRAAITLLGPVGVANTALATQLLAGHGAGGRLVARIGAAALAVVAGLLVVPQWLGAAVLGSAWPGRAVLALIGATVAAQTVSTWGLTHLKLAARRRALLVLRAGGAVALAATTVALALAVDRAAPVAAGYLAVNVALAVAAAHLARQPRPVDRPAPVPVASVAPSGDVAVDPRTRTA